MLVLGGRGAINPVLAQGRSGGASPLQFAPYLWLDASQLSLSDGDSITTWTDASGNSRNATQATPTAKPTYKTNIINGKPVARFDGGDVLSVGVAADWKWAHDGTTNSTIFVVGKFGTTADPEAYYSILGTTGTVLAPNGFTIAHDTRSSASRDRVLLNVIGSSNIGSGIRALNVQSAGATPANTFVVATTIMRPGSATASERSELRTNGGTAAKNNTENDTLNTANPRHALQIGALKNSSNVDIAFLVGDIAEIIIYNSELSAADYGAVEQYLSAKYGISLA